MIELLILYELSKKVSTMYGISKSISVEFPMLLKPSIGTIKPALTRMEQSGFIKSQKTMSKGGRPSTYYSITNPGKVAFKGYVMANAADNPIQFLTNTRIKLYCADILSKEEILTLVKQLKSKAEYVLSDTNKCLKNNDEVFYHRIVLDNLSCEYKNLISLLEGIENACKH